MKDHGVLEGRDCQAERTIRVNEEDFKENVILRVNIKEHEYEKIREVAEVEEIVVPPFGAIIVESENDQTHYHCCVVVVIQFMWIATEYVGSKDEEEHTRNERELIDKSDERGALHILGNEGLSLQEFPGKLFLLRAQL